MRTLLAVLVLLLVATNVATLAVLVRTRRRATLPPPGAIGEMPPGATSGRDRRLITVEILNPLELAGARSRVAGIAGSVVPGITRRIVYDRAAKILKRYLAEYDVVADVRIHAVPAARAEPAPASPAANAAHDPAGTDQSPV